MKTINNMDDKQRQEWRVHNQTLQQAFRDYNAARIGYTSSQKKAKDKALERIEKALSWPPFLNLYFEIVGNDPSGFVRYGGLEFLAEKCIEQIDKIAQREMDYDY